MPAQVLVYNHSDLEHTDLVFSEHLLQIAISQDLTPVLRVVS